MLLTHDQPLPKPPSPKSRKRDREDDEDEEPVSPSDFLFRPLKRRESLPSRIDIQSAVADDGHKASLNPFKNKLPIQQEFPSPPVSGGLANNRPSSVTSSSQQTVLPNLGTPSSSSVGEMECGTCHRVFPNRTKLKAHEKSHQLERKFTCTHPGCKKSFTQQGNLIVHERTHSGEKPFVCTIDGCGKSFSQAGNLKAHILLHDGNKPYLCKLCDKRFAQLGNVKVFLVFIFEFLGGRYL
jgi:uncharacterized Zn-finger protein